jgi:hypothetical protein
VATDPTVRDTTPMGLLQNAIGRCILVAPATIHSHGGHMFDSTSITKNPVPINDISNRLTSLADGYDRNNQRDRAEGVREAQRFVDQCIQNDSNYASYARGGSGGGNDRNQPSNR